MFFLWDWVRGKGKGEVGTGDRGGWKWGEEMSGMFSGAVIAVMGREESDMGEGQRGRNA